MSHTPGPWNREKYTVYALMHHGWERGKETFRNRFTCMMDHDRECSQEEKEATANLIAAAPDLLAALEGLLEAIPEHEEAPAKVWIAARAAIAKARGEA